MSKKTAADAAKNVLVFEVNPAECPFREFRDNELHPEFWGLGPAAYRAAVVHSKSGSKTHADHVWLDDQTQPLPRSVRQYLNGWVRAEDLALNRWKAEAVVFEETSGKMSVADIQLSHAQVLLRSSFCRKALSACFLLEGVDTFTVEHQWDSFSFSIAPEGWRAKYHIYSPGMKPGGGQQHRPGLSKNGCYLVRLFYLGAWRCVWVSDQVPVDANDSPLLPFSPLLSNMPVGAKTGTRPTITTVMSPVVHLWPLLICKALLKLAVPDMNPDEELDSVEDELLADFNIMHSLTGSLSLSYKVYDPEELWRLVTSEVPVFAWDDDDDTLPSTVKSKGAKKPSTKEATVRRSLTSILLADTKDEPPYALPGITPAYEMDLLVSMARDLPLKKPLPEPDVALWKHYRWVDWARAHGLYEAYDCPRIRFLKVNGLLKLSYAPHLLDVLSTESLTAAFREEHGRTGVPIKKGAKEANRSATGNIGLPPGREELREWMQFNPVHQLVKSVSILLYPSMYQFTSAGSNPPVRITKGPPKPIDIAASKCAPMYLQIDGPEVNSLRISLNALHPRILLNSGVPILDFIEPAHLVLEKFEWFVDCDVPLAKAFVQTRGYDSVEIQFEPGRHICRLWVHSRINWHVMLLSDSALLFGTRDMIQCAAIRECPWASKFLSQLGTAFTNWIKVNRSNTNVLVSDKEFYKSYQPDLTWDPTEVGYDKSLLHWMFRQALKSLLARRLQSPDYRSVCIVLRRYFCDPDFGLPEKPRPQKSLRDIATMDPCDCLMPEAEEVEQEEECFEEQVTEKKPLVDEGTMAKLLTLPTYPIISQVCELATEEVPCGVLKEEREIVIRRHEAATVLQAHWRGAWARKCLRTHVVMTPDVLKAIMENSFGNFEALSALMNEFFAMYPEVKPAYSVASALTGTYGLRQFTGTTPVTPHCQWIPYFQGVFYCHEPVKVHFDVQSSVQYSTVAVYDNDTGFQMPQVYNAHITFDFTPNHSGYTVMGRGTLSQPAGVNTDAHWQLTILTSIDEVFHVCDNDLDGCREQPLSHSHKVHLDEVFLPNRRNILGGIQISVWKNEAISFRAAASSLDLEIEVILQTTVGGQMKTIAKCCGKGEVYWPYVRLESMVPLPPFPNKHSSKSQINLISVTKEGHMSSRSLKLPKTTKPVSGSSKHKSCTKMKIMPPDPKIYFIEVVASKGWPLTSAQWKRVDEIRNSSEFIKLDAGQQPKKPTKEKPTSAKDKDKDKQQVFSVLQPQPDDAYTVLECGLTIGGGAFTKRNDDRELELAAAIKSWDATEPGRNNRGAQIRKDFRTEFLEALPVPQSESAHTLVEECLGEEYGETDEKVSSPKQQGPTPASENGLLEMTVESEEEAKYLTMPEQLRDKFIPLYFVPFCLKEKDENRSVLMTLDIAEAAKKDRHARIEAALDRMKELQVFNELSVLGRQRTRCQLLEQLFVDCQWNPELTEVLEARDEAVAKETLNRTLSAAKKKQETKKK